jgi:hypothetical protein
MDSARRAGKSPAKESIDGFAHFPRPSTQRESREISQIVSPGRYLPAGEGVIFDPASSPVNEEIREQRTPGSLHDSDGTGCHGPAAVNLSSVERRGPVLIDATASLAGTQAGTVAVRTRVARTTGPPSAARPRDSEWANFPGVPFVALTRPPITDESRVI